MRDDGEHGVLASANKIRFRRELLKQTASAVTMVAVSPWLFGISLSAAGSSKASLNSASKCLKTNSSMFDVEDKVAFVTGGDSGIGLGIAKALLDAGMKVVITYRTRSHLEEAMKVLDGAGNRLHTVNVDVTDRAAMTSAAQETVRVFGKVHLLVNNAGVWFTTPLSDSTYDDWDWVMSINVNGVFNGIRAFLPLIKAHGEGGHLVATSSIDGLVSNAKAGVYSTTKFAVVGMMEALRAELADTNIGVSVFCPGSVNTNAVDSERNRPLALRETGVSAAPEQKAVASEDLTLAKTQAMTPFEAGRRVLQGIRNNDLYIISHPEYEQGIRDRSEALIASIPNEPAPHTRLASETLRNPMYIRERDRKLCDRKS